MFPSPVAADLQATVDALKGFYANPAAGGGVNQEQLEYVQKLFGVSSGFQPYDLSQQAYTYQPVFCPIRNRMPRMHLQGVNMEFKSINLMVA